MYKIAFTDIDGTLLNPARETSSATNAAVADLTAAGIPFILISSRMPAAMRWLQRDLGIAELPLIAFNGGLVLSGGETLHSCEIPLEICRTAYVKNADLGLSLQYFHADEWYVAAMDHYARREQNNTRVTPTVRPIADTLTDWMERGLGAHKIMAMGDPAGIDTLTAALEAAHPGALHLYRSKDDYLEIANREISKLTGVQKLLRHDYPELTLADCIAFGDNYNDIEMLRGVGTGVAVANAKPEVLAVADLVVAAGKEDGVAEGLTRCR